MVRSLRTGLAIAVVAAATACSDDPTSIDASGSEDVVLAPAFASLPGGFTDTDNSFGGAEGDAGDLGRDFGRTDGAHATDGVRDGDRLRDHRRHDHAFGGGLMGGGLRGLFLGVGLRDWLGHIGAFVNDCLFVPDLGRVVCRPVMRNGLTIARSFAFEDEAGVVQEAYSPGVTDLINSRVGVEGTIVRRDDIKSEVAHRSDRTVAGLAEGSTERTLDGSSIGREITTGTNDRGRFRLTRIVGDEVEGLVIPVVEDSDRIPYPIAGSVVREMEVRLAYGDRIVRQITRREEVIFDGSDTATLIITINGVTRTCSLPLPFGKPVCAE